MKTWELASYELIKTYENEGYAIQSAQFSKEGTLIVSGHGDGKVRLWDRQIGLLLKKIKAHSTDVNMVCFSPDGELIFSGADDKKAKLWDVFSYGSAKIYEGFGNSDSTELDNFSPQYNVSHICFSRDGALFLAGSGDGSVKLWETKGWNLVNTIVGIPRFNH